METLCHRCMRNRLCEGKNPLITSFCWNFVEEGCLTNLDKLYPTLEEMDK